MPCRVSAPGAVRLAARICRTDAVDALITDATAPPAGLDALREAGVDVTVVEGGS